MHLFSLDLNILFQTFKLKINKQFSQAKAFAWILGLVTFFNLFFLFSLTIQPIQVEASQTATFTASSDLMLLAAQSGSNHKFRRALGAGYGSYGGALGQADSLLKFNYSLPADAIVEKAEVVVRRKSKVFTGGAGADVGSNIYASRITQNWSDNTATWSNARHYAGSYGSTSFSAWPNTQNATINVTDVVRAWQSGTPNYGLALRSTTTGQGAWICSIRNYQNWGTGGSWNNCTSPQLKITYIVNNAPNKPIINNPDEGFKVGGEPYTANGKNCTENVGCEISGNIPNIWDPNVGTSGELAYSKLEFIPIDSKGEYFSKTYNGYQTDNQINFTEFVKDGLYTLKITSVDKKNFTNSDQIRVN